MEHRGLRVVAGEVESGVGIGALDPAVFQSDCVAAYVASRTARGFSPVTIENATGLLDRTLDLLGRPAWEVDVEDVDRLVGTLAADGLSVATRRGYVQSFKGFYRFLQVRQAAVIEAAFGVRLVCPVDEFNASRHVGGDSPGLAPPPTVERMDEFFGFLRGRIATARKYAPAARDYALFRTLYHAGLRADEASQLGAADAHFDRGPFGKLHVRYGKGTRGLGSAPPLGADARWPGPRARLVPVRRPGQVPGLRRAVP